jgi:hypothetical protein
MEEYVNVINPLITFNKFIFFINDFDFPLNINHIYIPTFLLNSHEKST